MLNVTDYKATISLENDGEYVRQVSVTNNGFGADWVVFTQDPNEGPQTFAIALSRMGKPATVINVEPGGEVDLRVNNTSILKIEGTAITLRLGSTVGETDPHVPGQLWRIGTALQVSAG